MPFPEAGGVSALWGRMFCRFRYIASFAASTTFRSVPHRAYVGEEIGKDGAVRSGNTLVIILRKFSGPIFSAVSAAVFLMQRVRIMSWETGGNGDRGVENRLQIS